ncbi:MAG: DUF6263 family protein [Bacteroidota bacterium]|nr:DUF6263 family protein [Bacteroidota bacterium]
MKKITLVIATLSFVSTITFAQVNGTINPSPGQKFIVENKLKTVSSSEMMGQTMESNADVTSTYKIEVKSIKNNNINFLNTFTGLKMNMKVMENDMSFDSDKKEDMDGDLGKNFKDILNQPKDVVMDKSGNVILSDKPESANESGADNPAMLAMKQMGGDPAEQGYGAKITFEVIPSNIKVGSNWTDSSSNGGVTKITHYTVKEINGNECKLGLSGTIAGDIKAQMQGMEILTKTTGDFTGEETVDLKTGVIKENNSSTDAKGTITVMGQEIPTSSKITSVTTVKPI